MRDFAIFTLGAIALIAVQIAIVYWRRHKRAGKPAGQNSREPVRENIVIKKGT